MPHPLTRARNERIDEHGLTDRQRLFCDAYIAHGFSALRKCYLMAFGQDADPNHALRESRKKAVKIYLDEAREETSRRFAVDAHNVLNELASIGFADIREIVDPITGEPKPIDELPARVAHAISRVEVVNTENHGERTTAYRYTMHPKVEALKKLGEHLALYERKHEQRSGDFARQFLETAATFTAGALPGAVGPPTDGD